jgi:hypothetical protein
VHSLESGQPATIQTSQVSVMSSLSITPDGKTVYFLDSAGLDRLQMFGVRFDTYVTERTGDMGYTFFPGKGAGVGCHGRKVLLWTNAYDS